MKAPVTSGVLATLSILFGLVVLTSFKLASHFASVRERTPSPGVLHRTERKTLKRWAKLLHRYGKNKIRTRRIGCREFDAGAQTCTFEGIVCIDTTNATRKLRSSVYFIDDTKPDGVRVPDDDYVTRELKPATPWFHGPVEWPLRPGTVVPRQSGLIAEYRKSHILKHKRIKWLPTLWFVDLLWGFRPHNNDLLVDVLWILDAQLYKNSTDRVTSPAYPRNSHFGTGIENELFAEGPHYVYTPHSKESMDKQLKVPVNRLTWALMLNLDPNRLYKSGSRKSRGKALPFFKAYPDISKRLLLHKKIAEDGETDLVCTSRFTTGPKRFNYGHDRNCEHIRRAGYRLFGVRYPRIRQVGPSLRYAQPPRRVVVVQRHYTRGFKNIDEIMNGLHEALDPHGVPVSLVLTSELVEPEDWVRKFAQAGVVITTHGSQSMGQLWMPRFSVFIEVFPVGFYDYCFSFTAKNCGLWYFGLDSMIDPKRSKRFYRKKRIRLIKPLIDKNYHVPYQAQIIADVPKLVKTTREALAKIGHEVDDYIDNVPVWKERKGEKNEDERQKQ